MSQSFPVGPAERKAGPYTASAGQTAFTFAFPLLDAADLRVEFAPAATPEAFEQVDAGDYTLSPAPPSEAGGTVTLATGLAAGDQVQILGAAVVANTQDVVPAGKVDSSLLNRFFDRMTMWAQELRRDIASTRGPVGPAGPVGPPGSDGTDGADGTDGQNGNRWYSGDGVPSAGLGLDGDMYLRTSNSDVYGKAAGAWSVIDNFSGAPGAGSGDVVGPAGSTDGNVATFSGGTGKLLGAGFPVTTFAKTVLDDANAADARTTLGVVIGTHVQAFSALLAAIAGLSAAADRLPYFTGAATAALATFTAAGRTLVGAADAAAQRVALGLGNVATLAKADAAAVRGGTADAVVTADAVHAAMAPAALSYGGTINIDHAAGFTRTVTLAGNPTIAAPSNAKPGMPLNLLLTQDGSGNRTITWNAAFKFGGDGPPALSTAGGARDLVTFFCNAAGDYVFLGIRAGV